MKKLLQGVSEFMGNIHETELALFTSLAHGQSPDSFFVTCSDSRVAPHLITQTGPGELFVLRNAGNFIPGDPASGEAATIEYAASVLEVQDAILCGHSDCGAVKALLNPPPAGQLPSIDLWLGHGAEVLEILSRHPEWQGQTRIDRAIEINVLVQLTRLSRHPAVAKRLADGSLRLHAWVYDIGAGEIRAFDSEQGRFEAIAEARATPVPAHNLAVVPHLAS